MRHRQMREVKRDLEKVFGIDAPNKFAVVFERCRDGNSSNQVESVHKNRHRHKCFIKIGYSLRGSLKQKHDTS